MTASSGEQLETAFINVALQRSEWLRLSEVDKANNEFDRLHELKNQLRELPDKGVAVLRRITGNADVNVSMVAAVALLSVDEEFAINVLEGIAQSEVGIPSFSAEMALKEWRRGAMRDYWK
jgi:hypothetical protein